MLKESTWKGWTMRVSEHAEVIGLYRVGKCLSSCLNKQTEVYEIAQFVESKMSPNMADFLGVVEERVEGKEAWLSYRMGYGDWPGREVSQSRGGATSRGPPTCPRPGYDPWALF